MKIHSQHELQEWQSKKNEHQDEDLRRMNNKMKTPLQHELQEWQQDEDPLPA
jgi:hypothetical protein